MHICPFLKFLHTFIDASIKYLHILYIAEVLVFLIVDYKNITKNSRQITEYNILQQ